MPVSKSRRKKQVPSQKLAHNRVFLSSKEHRELLVKLYMLEDKVKTIQNFLGAMIKNASKQAEDASLDTSSPPPVAEAAPVAEASL